MLRKLQTLFIPHESNNQKAKVLHLSSLIFLLFFIAFFQVSLTVLSYVKPGVLGFSSNIEPQTIIELTNQERQTKGLASLQSNSVLAEAARQKASQMFTFGCWSHNCHGKTPWWFFKNVGYHYLYAGENLAKDFGDSSSVVKAWMDSPTHRDNILNDNYKEIGVAVVNGVLNGEETTLVVQMFGRPDNNKATLGDASQQVAIKPQTAVKSVEAKKPAPAPKTKKEPAIMAQAPIKKSQPIVSGFDLTRILYLFLIGVLIIILAIDSFLISKNKIVRISGKSFIHLSFFLIILISILLTTKGIIL